jgi:hypothetical protein
LDNSALGEADALEDELLFCKPELSAELELRTASEATFITLDELFPVELLLAEIKVVDDELSFFVTDNEIDEVPLLVVSAYTLFVVGPKYKAVPAITLTTPTDSLRS